MATTKLSTDVIDLSGNTEALTIPSGTTSDASLTVDYLIVAGGGGGGGGGQAFGAASGGGAGGYRNSFSTESSGGNTSTETPIALVTATNYTVTVGTGGGGGSTSPTNGTNGNNSVFYTITATGGGGGINVALSPAGVGQDGGSGGGGGYYGGTGGGSGGSGSAGQAVTPTQGFNGGFSTGTTSAGPGGGGAAALGVDTSGSGNYGAGSAGGAGLSSNIDGGNTPRAGGGGGSSYNNGSSVNYAGGAGGSGGGGAGGGLSPGTGTFGGANGIDGTGGGGGAGAGADSSSSGGGDGGKGIVILRYPNIFTATYTAGTGGAADSEVTIGNDKYIKITAGTGTVSFSGTPITSGRPSSPTEGLMRENTTTGKMEFYDGSIWQEINDTANSYSPGFIPSANFNTVLYSGTSSTPTVITGVGFKPDFTWLKARNNAWPHGLFSSLMPIYATTGGYEYMYSDRTDDSEALWGSLQFDDDGWSGLAGSYNGTFAHDFGMSGYNYVSWNWKAGGAATTITAGTVGNDVSSDVSANTDAGFSIVKYTGTLGAAGNLDVAHGLGAAPEIIISKRTDSAGPWRVRPFFLNSNPYNYLELNNTNAIADINSSDGTMAMPTNNVFSNNWNSGLGGIGDVIAYCWRSIPGYSKIGFYVGTETTRNIYMGFKPAWIMLKSTTSGAGNSYWTIFDNKRNPSNPRTCEIYPNSSDTEYCTVGSAPNYRGLNFTDTGIELLSTSYTNEAFETFIYMAFSE